MQLLRSYRLAHAHRGTANLVVNELCTHLPQCRPSQWLLPPAAPAPSHSLVTTRTFSTAPGQQHPTPNNLGTPEQAPQGDPWTQGVSVEDGSSNEQAGNTREGRPAAAGAGQRRRRISSGGSSGWATGTRTSERGSSSSSSGSRTLRTAPQRRQPPAAGGIAESRTGPKAGRQRPETAGGEGDSFSPQDTTTTTTSSGDSASSGLAAASSTSLPSASKAGRKSATVPASPPTSPSSSSSSQSSSTLPPNPSSSSSPTSSPPSAATTAATIASQLAQVAGASPARPSDHEACFRAAVAAHGLTSSQSKQLLTYLDYMLETNKVMNLTAVRDRSEALTRHLVDSLALLPVIDHHLAATAAAAAAGSSGPSGAPLRVIDVGTGAGLPGMVLAVARPSWNITLLDTLRKRCDFLQRAAQEAGLTNVQVVWSRAEDGARKPELRDSFDLAVARAVADSRVLAELCMPYVKPGGLWVAAKGPDPEVEVAAAANAIKVLGGSPALLERVASFSGDGQRTALVVRKTRPTPPIYPRAPGTPNKAPL